MRTQQEAIKREKLKHEKPEAYAKVIKFKEKIERGESITILQFQFDYRCNFRCSHCSVIQQNQSKPKRIAS